MDVTRPGWDDYFFRITDLVASRSTCLRRKVGAILVRDRRILSTGYNGAPQGLAHCLDIGCLREKLGVPSGQRHELCRAIHAEQNAIIQAARHGVSVVDSDLYCSAHPCVICTKMLINSGVKRIYFREGYPDELSAAMLNEADVQVVKMELI
jgi:dCMP deaminase